MNPQQVTQPRSSANGFTRRRGEKETVTRVENKPQPAKPNFNRITTPGGGESPSRERLVYLTTCLIGHQVEVQVIDGSVFSGIFHATNAEKDFGVILKMARLTKAAGGQKNISDSVLKPPSKTLIIPAKELVQIVAKSVSVTRDGLMNEVQREEVQDIMIDSSISHSRHADLERELAPWVPDDDNPECPELDNTFERHWNRGWDQFEANATLFGVKSTFNEELYTTKLDRGRPQMREIEKEALRIAREIEGEDTHDLHLAEERGIRYHDKFDLDEETKYSSVFRGVDDSGYDENEDIILDSQNSETFGDVSESVVNKLFINENDLLYPSGPLDGESRIEDNETNQQDATSSCNKEDTEKHMLYEESHASKSEESTNKESSDKGLNVTATAYPPPLSKSLQEKTSCSEVSSVSVSVSEGVKMHHHQRPGSSASSTSDSGNTTPAPAPAPATATGTGRGLSRTSSVGSEKSTLNPHAKEFRLNPNAKAFVPSPGPPLRAASPVSDGGSSSSSSFYYPPHMPVGFGMGPAFPLHQPGVIFGPQGTPMQSPQTYFHANGPQYGQQMLVGQPRQVVYMPTYPPEMPYKGREF